MLLCKPTEGPRGGNYGLLVAPIVGLLDGPDRYGFPLRLRTEAGNLFVQVVWAQSEGSLAPITGDCQRMPDRFAAPIQQVA